METLLVILFIGLAFAVRAIVSGRQRPVGTAPAQPVEAVAPPIAAYTPNPTLMSPSRAMMSGAADGLVLGLQVTMIAGLAGGLAGAGADGFRLGWIIVPLFVLFDTARLDNLSKKYRNATDDERRKIDDRRAAAERDARSSSSDFHSASGDRGGRGP